MTMTQVPPEVSTQSSLICRKAFALLRAMSLSSTALRDRPSTTLRERAFAERSRSAIGSTQEFLRLIRSRDGVVCVTERTTV